MSALTSHLRVCSVLPSATEILCFVGGEHLLVGRSHEDNYPASVQRLPILTGQRTQFTTAADVDRQVSASLKQGDSLYTLDVDALAALAPDLILTQDICSVCAIDLPTVERAAAAMGPSPPRVLSLNPLTLDDVLRNVLEVGAAAGLEASARAAHARLVERIGAVEARARADGAAPRYSNVAFIEWPDPLYVGGHWTPELIERAGGSHPLHAAAAGGGSGRSFAISADALVASDPDVIVFCPCGLDLAATRREAARLEKLAWWRSLAAVRAGRVVLVDGDAMFNRPGPRLVDCLEWLAAVLRGAPEPRGFPSEWLPPPPPPAAEPPATRGADARDADGAMRDIEEAHRGAVAAGQLQYTDPETGYQVFTQLASSKRGHCCGSGCRHCAYGHQNVPADRRAALRPPITVKL